LAEINTKIDALEASGIDVVAVSADPVDVTAPLVAAKGLKFPVASGLTEENMRTLGVYVSDPKDYQPQKYRFSEPGYFFLTKDNIIKYICIASHPMGGRINIDALLAGINWSEEQIKIDPNFAQVTWGGK
jgi:peroxiredoxin